LIATVMLQAATDQALTLSQARGRGLLMNARVRR